MLLRSADGDMRRVPALVAEMVAQGAGVLIVVGAAALKVADQAVKQAAGDKRVPTPIVAIDLESDPVREGYAASLAPRVATSRASIRRCATRRCAHRETQPIRVCHQPQDGQDTGLDDSAIAAVAC